ncbi:MAG: BrxA/BrxB family bacilliredoxin, partial [Bacteroidota bacterium]
MPYPEALVSPMRAELARLGITELHTASDVEQALAESEEGTSLVVINSVCGCSAASARPAVAMALQSPVTPDRSYTVFAGQDMEATARMREHLAGIPPSSPFVALLKDGDPVYVVERKHIEGRSAH